ncbi:MAG: hypothetical protein V3U71_14115 [Cocleimonas sp.]
MNKTNEKTKQDAIVNLKKQQAVIKTHNNTTVNWIVGILALIHIALVGLIIDMMFRRKLHTVFDDEQWLVLIVLLTTVLTAVVVITKKPRLVIMGFIGIAITGILLQFLSTRGFHGTSLFYIGLPLILAYLFKNLDSSSSAMGGILKGITIVMLLSAPILQEGFICILMAAPLFYIVGGLIGFMIDYSRKKQLSTLQASPMFLLIALMSLEGTHPDLTFPRQHTVIVEQVVAANSEAIKGQLRKPLVLGNDVPMFLKIFPFPDAPVQFGTKLGDKTKLHFVYNKHVYFNPKIGDLVYEVTAVGDNFIESKILSDDSYVNTYLNWQKGKVSWQALDKAHTKVTWEIHYERKLDPAWYFGTLEYYTTILMANALIKYAATPEYARK